MNLVCLSILALATLIALPVHAKELVFVTYPGVAPYIIQSEDKPTGIEIDVVEAAMDAAGLELRFTTVPFGRGIKQFKDGEVDAALTISLDAGLDLGDAHYSDNHITFRNVAITLTENDYDLPDIASLGNYSVAAFEFAKEYLGADFADMAESNPNYSEMIPDTRPIPPTLFAGRADVVVIELNIFKHHMKNETYTVPTDKEITVHNIFPENPFVVAFADPDVRDAFNAGLKSIREDGTYETILERYVGQ